MGERGEVGGLLDVGPRDEAADEQLLVHALGRACASPAGLPLVGSKAHGLFPASAAGKNAARVARQAGYLKTIRSEKHGRTSCDICTITPGGLARLLEGHSRSSWTNDLIAHLSWWQHSGPSGDCPIPELYRRAQAVAPLLTLGLFHDGLRNLYERQQIYLHPWTGPLCDLPHPQYALLVGHEIAYYASARGEASGLRGEEGKLRLFSATTPHP